MDEGINGKIYYNNNLRKKLLCGYCNKSYINMEDHLQTKKHNLNVHKCMCISNF